MSAWIVTASGLEIFLNQSVASFEDASESPLPVGCALHGRLYLICLFVRISHL